MKEVWKVGKNTSTVVSNIPSIPDEKSGHNDVGYYGGFLVCESIATKEYANLIASALEMKQMLNHFINAIEGGEQQGEGAIVTGYKQTFGITMIAETKRILKQSI